MCLSNIASNTVKYEDQEFTDPVTREKYTYQARVYTDLIKLQSSFWPNSINSVNCSIWFQEDLPFPGVDLSKLRPSKGDIYPREIAEYIDKETYDKIFRAVIEANFDGCSDYPTEDRLFD